MGISGNVRADVCVVGLGPSGRALASRAAAVGLTVVAVDPHPHRRWYPTYSCWVDELPSWLPEDIVATRVEKPTVWTPEERRIERPYAVLAKDVLAQTLSLDHTQTMAARAVELSAHRVVLADGRIVTATTVFDARGLPYPGRRPTASAYGVLVDADAAAPMVPEGEALLLDWREEHGAGSNAPPSFLYAVPLGDGRVLFEETSLGVPGGIPQVELRRRVRCRLGAHGVPLYGEERHESAHYPLDQRPPPRRHPLDAAIPYGARGGLVHPCTGYSVANSLRRADAVVAALVAGYDPVAALWPPRARLTHWLRRRGMSGMGRLTTAQTTATFHMFFTASPERQRALLSEDDPVALATAMVSTVGHTWPFRWRFDMVGWTNRHRWDSR